jgi:hypothetical protein
MGFSQSTRQYKLFRFSSDDPSLCYDRIYSYLDVYTLGDDIGSWRRHPRKFLNRVVYHIHSPPPALVDGKLYVLTEQPGMVPDMLLVIDVARVKRISHTAYLTSLSGDRGPICTYSRCVGGYVSPCAFFGTPMASICSISGSCSHWDSKTKTAGCYIMYMEVGSSATPAFYMDHDGNKEPRCAWFDTGDRMLNLL